MRAKIELVVNVAVMLLAVVIGSVYLKEWLSIRSLSTS